MNYFGENFQILNSDNNNKKSQKNSVFWPEFLFIYRGNTIEMKADFFQIQLPPNIKNSSTFYQNSWLVF